MLAQLPPAGILDGEGFQEPGQGGVGDDRLFVRFAPVEEREHHASLGPSEAEPHGLTVEEIPGRAVPLGLLQAGEIAVEKRLPGRHEGRARLRCEPGHHRDGQRGRTIHVIVRGGAASREPDLPRGLEGDRQPVAGGEIDLELAAAFQPVGPRLRKLDVELEGTVRPRPRGQAAQLRLDAGRNGSHDRDRRRALHRCRVRRADGQEEDSRTDHFGNR